MPSVSASLVQSHCTTRWHPRSLLLRPGCPTEIYILINMLVRANKDDADVEDNDNDDDDDDDDDDDNEES